MPNITKPTAPSFKVADMNESLAKVKDTIDELKTRNGTVSVAKVEQKLADDPMALQAFGAIKDEFQRTVTRRVSSCSGSSVETFDVDPKRLKANEIEDVMTALIKAKTKVGNLDRNHDGTISAGEGNRAGNLRGMSGDIIRAAIEGTREDYATALEAWCEKLVETADEVESRVEIEDEINGMADWHAKTKRGAKALAWAFRGLATAGEQDAVWKMDNILRRAETGGQSPLLAAVYGTRDSGGEGHLSDAEIKTLLAVTNLDTYSRRTAAEIKDRVGGTYATHYLKGHDLPGGKQLGDADFLEYRDSPSGTGC